MDTHSRALLNKMLYCGRCFPDPQLPPTPRMRDRDWLRPGETLFSKGDLYGVNVSSEYQHLGLDVNGPADAGQVWRVNDDQHNWNDFDSRLLPGELACVLWENRSKVSSEGTGPPVSVRLRLAHLNPQDWEPFMRHLWRGLRDHMRDLYYAWTQGEVGWYGEAMAARTNDLQPWGGLSSGHRVAQQGRQLVVNTAAAWYYYHVKHGDIKPSPNAWLGFVKERIPDDFGIDPRTIGDYSVSNKLGDLVDPATMGPATPS